MSALTDDDIVERGRIDFVRELNWRRLCLFRASLQVAVRSASPLAAPLAGMLGRDMVAVAEELAPRYGWMVSSIPARSAEVTLSFSQWRLPPLPSAYNRPDLILRLFHRGGHLQSVGGKGWVGWHTVSDAIEVMGQLGPVAFVTRGGTLRIRIPGPLPETVKIASIGRPLASVVELPSFAQPNWKISAVDARTNGSIVLRVRTGQLEHEMPWRNLVDELRSKAALELIDDYVGF